MKEIIGLAAPFLGFFILCLGGGFWDLFVILIAIPLVILALIAIAAVAVITISTFCGIFKLPLPKFLR